MKNGRVEEDFKTNQVRPGLFYTARLVPMSYDTVKSIVGAVVFKVQGTNQFYTLAFEDPFVTSNKGSIKGHIEEGNDPNGAMLRLKDQNPKQNNWGSYDLVRIEDRGKSVFTFRGNRRWTIDWFNSIDIKFYKSLTMMESSELVFFGQMKIWEEISINDYSFFIFPW